MTDGNHSKFILLLSQKKKKKKTPNVHTYFRYADTILSPQEISTKPALSSGTKMVSVTQSSFYNINTPKKVCCCCSKPMSTSFIQDNLSYCKECHLKLFNKGQW